MGFFQNQIHRLMTRKPYKVEVTLKIGQIELGPIKMVVKEKTSELAELQARVDLNDALEYHVNVLGRLKGRELKSYERSLEKFSKNV